jgi:hypothetical protein
MGQVSLSLADCPYKGKTTIQCMYIPEFVKDPVDKPFRRCESKGLLDLKNVATSRDLS